MKENYIIKQTENNAWAIIDEENEQVVNVITKDIVIEYCKIEFEEKCTECMSADIVLDSVWFNVDDDYDLEFIDNHCPEFKKFVAWFNYICVDYCAKEIVAIYKQELLNFE